MDTITVSSYLSGIKGLGELNCHQQLSRYITLVIFFGKNYCTASVLYLAKELHAERLSRHWYDVDCLLQHQFADLYDTKEAMHNVIEMKQQRWPFAGVDYTLVAKGELRLITEDSGRLAAIAEDHRIAIEGGMFLRSLTGLIKSLNVFSRFRMNLIVL